MMLGICLFFFFAAARAALPNPPKVTVSKDVLKDFGVTIDPNAPGFFDKLIKNATAGREVEAIKQKTKVTVIIDVDQMSARDFISLLEKLPIEEHAQFAVAHMLNIYFRLYNFTQQFDNKIMESITKFSSLETNEATKFCQQDLFMGYIAIQYSQDFNARSGCVGFQQLLSKELILSKKLSDVSFATQSLMKMDSLLDDKNVPLEKVQQFMTTAPHLPKMFQAAYYNQIKDVFSDYVQFINQIETKEEGHRELKEVLRFVKIQLLYNLKTFWDLSSHLDG